MQLESTQKKKVISYECHGGMIESVIPLFVANELVGYGMIGQFRTSDKLPIKIQKRWDKMACGEDLAQAYQKAPVFEQERLDYIVQLFEIFADFIVHHRMVTRKEYNNFDTLLMYMDEHPAENLRLAQAADIACRSKSAFSHTFKTLMGKSFKQYQIQMKLARADEYFQQRPDITIREVAYKLGYEDPLYFSKLYHKNRGVSPVTNRKKKR
jgi:AraC-like DNA-binding protein